jgi:hypothetical protein
LFVGRDRMDRRAASRCRLIVGTADKGLFLRRTKSPPDGGLDRTLAEGSLAGSCREAGTARALNGGPAPCGRGLLSPNFFPEDETIL